MATTIARTSCVELEIALLGLVKGIPQEALTLISRKVFSNPHNISLVCREIDREMSFTAYLDCCRARERSIERYYERLYTNNASRVKHRMLQHPEIKDDRKLSTEFQIYNKMVIYTLGYDPNYGTGCRSTGPPHLARKPFKKLLLKTFATADKPI